MILFIKLERRKRDYNMKNKIKNKLNKKQKTKQRDSLIIIANLMLSILAIGFMIGLESGMVSGGETADEITNVPAPKVDEEAEMVKSAQSTTAPLPSNTP